MLLGLIRRPNRKRRLQYFRGAGGEGAKSRVPAREKGQEMKTGNSRLLDLCRSHSGITWLISAVFALLSYSELAQSNPIAVEKIFLSQFGEQAVEILPRIEFADDRNQIFSAAGETKSAAVWCWMPRVVRSRNRPSIGLPATGRYC